MKRSYSVSKWVLGNLISTSALLLGCSGVKFESRSSSSSASQGTKAEVFCANPWTGDRMGEGASVHAYQYAKVPYGARCPGEDRVCRGGILSGSYQNANCEVDQPKNCNFNGQEVKHGDEVPAYAAATVPYGSQCQPEKRTCNNGKLSGSYTYSGCAAAPPANCPFNGQVVRHGEFIQLYRSQSVPYGSQCEPEKRICTNGVLSGSATAVTCQQLPPADCKFNDQIIKSGDSITVYKSQSVPYNSQCEPEKRICTNGVLSGSATAVTCQQLPPADCKFNDQVIKSGDSITVYKSQSVPYNSQCEPEKRICTNGVLSGSATAVTCQQLPPADCKFNDQVIKSGDSITAFKSSFVPYDAKCEPEKRTCSNGVLSGSLTIATCEQLPPSNCTFNGEPVKHGEGVTAYETASVPFGSACKSDLLICDNGKFSGTFREPACSEQSAANCTFNNQTVLHKDVIKAFKTKMVGYNQSCESEDRRCYNGQLDGSFANGSCEKQPILQSQISVTTSKVYSPFKLLIVVDNSFTMSQSQQKIAQNIDSLLSPLRGRDVDVKIITTTDGEGYENFLKVERSVYTGTQYLGPYTWDPVGSSIFYQYPTNSLSFRKDYGITRGDEFSLKSADSLSELNNKIEGIRQSILSKGTSGSDTEKFFCPLLRQVVSPDKVDAFFKSGDKAAVVLLSDEDDSSSYQDCLAQRREDYGPLTSFDQVKYSVTGKYVYVYWATEVRTMVITLTNDGVTSGVITITSDGGSGSVPISVVNPEYLPLGTCDQTTLRRASDWVRNHYPDSQGLTSCEVNVETYEFPSYLTALNDYSKNFCECGKTFNWGGISYTLESFYNNVNGNRLILDGSCKRQRSSSWTRTLLSSDFTPLLPTASTDSDFVRQTMTKAKTLFGSNYFMTFIVNDATCPLQQGQSQGQRYMTVARDSAFSSNVATYPICAGSYTPALDQLSKFVVDKISTDYVMAIPADAQVIGVKIVRAGGGVVALTSNQYAVTGLSLQIKVDLFAGDQIQIDYVRPF